MVRLITFHIGMHCASVDETETRTSPLVDRDQTHQKSIRNERPQSENLYYILYDISSICTPVSDELCGCVDGQHKNGWRATNWKMTRMNLICIQRYVISLQELPFCKPIARQHRAMQIERMNGRHTTCTPIDEKTPKTQDTPIYNQSNSNSKYMCRSPSPAQLKVFNRNEIWTNTKRNGLGCGEI